MRVVTPIEVKQGEKSIVELTVAKANIYICQINAITVAISRSGAGNTSTTGIGNTITEVVKYFNSVVAIVNVGVAFGLCPDTQHLGDIVVSNKIIDYATVKYTETGGFEERGGQQASSVALLRRFEAARTKARTHSPPFPNISIASVVSGPILYNNRTQIDALMKRFPNAEAGEMEGNGLWITSEHIDSAWILVKSICDWGDGSNAKEWQLYCAYQAARLLHLAMGKHFLTGLVDTTSAAASK